MSRVSSWSIMLLCLMCPVQAQDRGEAMAIISTTMGGAGAEEAWLRQHTDGLRFVRMIPLSPDKVLVVAEGEMEARSIGTYSVKVYRCGNSTGRLLPDDFLCGEMVDRDGFIDAVVLADVLHDGAQEILVKMKSAGSGGYVSVDVFALHRRKLVSIGAIRDLPPDADGVAEVERWLASGHGQPNTWVASRRRLRE